MQSKAKKHSFYSAVAVAGSLLITDVVSAQVLEEVLVTARKRSESMQDVPMAISAFGAQQLQANQIDNITDLQKMTPNITTNETSGLVAGATWLAVFALNRISSLASLSAFVVAPACIFAWLPQAFWPMLALSLVMILRHRSNLQKLLRGEELGFRQKD